ncbi:MAG: DUF6198 family protein [Eubacteriales bacterium]|nr:DUF6198 family protein [Eubacteriales bacterium]
MKTKRTFYTELAYVLGVVALTFGTAFMERADFGMSMVVAPSYLIYLKVAEVLPFFTFGMAEYTLQAVLLVALCLIMRKFRRSYLFAFVTAVFYGVTLDGVMLLVGLLPGGTIAYRIAFYVLGLITCAVGVSLLFHTYISPEAYELFVMELADKTGKSVHKVKTIYDCVSCAVGVALSFAFFGPWHFEGVKWGTILCALINGFLIGRCTKIFEHFFEFRDGLRWRTFFEK